MDSVELSILKLFLFPENYKKYGSFLRSDFLAANNRVLGTVFSALNDYYSSDSRQKPEGGSQVSGIDSSKVLSSTDLQLLVLNAYPAMPQAEKELLGKLCKSLDELSVDPAHAERYVAIHIERIRAQELASLGVRVAEGKEPFSKLLDLVKTYGTDVREELKDEFVTDDLGELLRSHVETGGLHWRLSTLNKMIGPLRKGDFGFVFARPETGKTTFLASEVTFMAEKSERPVLWVNNEENGGKVKLRCYEAYFGKPLKAIMSQREHYFEDYKKAMGGRIRLYDKPFTHRKDVERVCQQISPSLIVFDQIDKIRGFDSDRYDLEMKAVYQWSRELAKEYGPVIGICQAGASGEGKAYLTMDDVDSSKTAKQGEADWILGIGKTHKEGMEAVRHLHVMKNKLVGDMETDESIRHGKADILILPQIARYADYE